MKRLFLLISITLAFYSCSSTKFDCVDKRACREYEKKLDSLSDFLFFQKELNSSTEKWFDGFFEKITYHESEADMSYAGMSPPTINDYNIWALWYSENYNRLRYNKKEKSVYAKGSYLKFLEQKAENLESREIFIFPHKERILMVLSENKYEPISEIDASVYYLESDLEYVKRVFKILETHEVLSELYTYSTKKRNQGYIEVNSNSRNGKGNHRLYFQIKLGSSRYTKTYFVLIDEVEKAKNILSDLEEYFKSDTAAFQRFIEALNH